MIAVFEIFVLAWLGYAVIRALRSWHEFRAVSATFDLDDIIRAFHRDHCNGKEARIHTWIARNFILIILVILMVFVCFCGRAAWALQNYWVLTGDGWGYFWLTTHTIIGAVGHFCVHLVNCAFDTIEDWDGIDDGV